MIASKAEVKSSRMRVLRKQVSAERIISLITLKTDWRTSNKLSSERYVYVHQQHVLIFMKEKEEWTW